MRLLKCEQEVIISFDADSDVATLYSAYPKWIRKMDKLVEQYPDIYKLVGETDVSKTYSMPKEYISCRKPRNYSDAYREQKRNHAHALSKTSTDNKKI